MKMNKKGLHPFIWVVSILLIIAAGVGTVTYFRSNTSQNINVVFSVEPSRQIGEVVNQPAFNWLSYFVGEVPEWLISQTSQISAIIIIIAIWFILLLTFGDIVAAFGTFSNEYVGWGIGTLLAVIAANMKLVMYIATWSFMATAGLGVLSVAFALAIPFVIFLFVQFGSQKIANFSRMRKLAYKRAKGIDRVRGGVRTAAAMGGEAEAAGE